VHTNKAKLHSTYLRISKVDDLRRDAVAAASVEQSLNESHLFLSDTDMQQSEIRIALRNE